MSTSTISKVSAEYQLLQTAIDTKSQSGTIIPSGTVLLRIFYPAGYVFTRVTSSNLTWDSWNTKHSAKSGARTIEMLATSQLMAAVKARCAPSNMAFNRMRTVQLERCLALPSVVQLIRDEWDMCISSVELFPGITSGNNFDDWADEVPPIFASDWNDEELWASTIKQLKVIAKKLGIKIDGNKAEIISQIKASH